MSDLAVLATNINEAVERSRLLYKEGVEVLGQALISDRDAGLMLIKAKKSVPHGEFIKWIETNCKFTPRHAQFLMKIATEWEKIIIEWEKVKNETRFAFKSLPSLRQAIALASAEPKEEPTPNQVAQARYKVALPNHECYGEVVEVAKVTANGDVLVCKTSKGEYPFLRGELIEPDKPLKAVEVEIIDVEIEDKAEELREAIATLIEYFPENQLKTLLVQAVALGKDFLPENVKAMVGKCMSETYQLEQV
ncbi:DUF3102 domain-containing protein [Aulosira sp. FACHB-615]|uniref:DUF3102 domain-containing protein n=1 Tax=Aulosira sp. FACHB-615 TaxID=2692777 RepID=UPI001685A03A|nr:DUF3102 domain-containing protein [Aulosira sp. FACHB-615]MBD2489013.1 DUF3102 domain-containing protein [Aulosira sp. FACHB-615]